MKWIIAFGLCFGFLGSEAQVRVLFHLENADDSCFLAGNINRWTPGDLNFRFSSKGDLVLELPAKTLV